MSATRWHTAAILLALGCMACRGHTQESLQITIRRQAVELAVGDTTTLIAVVTVTSQETPTTVIWSSDNGSVATVDRNGLVRARAAGVARITARMGTAFASARVSVQSRRSASRADSTAKP